MYWILRIQNGDIYFEFVVNNNYRGARPGLGGNKLNACILKLELCNLHVPPIKPHLKLFWEKMKILKSFLLYQVLNAQNEPTTTTATTTIATTTTTTTTTATTTVKSAISADTRKKVLELPVEVNSRYGFIESYLYPALLNDHYSFQFEIFKPTLKSINQWNYRKYSETSCNRTWY